MLDKDFIQQVLDHFYVGKISELNFFTDYIQVKTNQGTFFILESDPLTARSTEPLRYEVIERLYGKMERILRRNLKGEFDPEVSYAHKNGKYYSVYKSIRKE